MNPAHMYDPGYLDDDEFEDLEEDDFAECVECQQRPATVGELCNVCDEALAWEEEITRVDNTILDLERGYQ